MKIETLKDLIQSGNINFLIGSGLSRPFLPVLGNIERQMDAVKELPSKNQDIVAAVLYKAYFQKVIFPNMCAGDKKDAYDQTLQNYADFLLLWNDIIHNRCGNLRSKQVNLFSTNIDLFVERAVEKTGVEYNDGFIGSVMPVFSEANFQKTIYKNSIHFQNSTELPVFNLLKIHGSINWREVDGRVINDYSLGLISNTQNILSKYAAGDFPCYKKTNAEILEQIKDTSDYSDFLNAYSHFLIVNPTKKKFSETVFDVHFYELMRLLSNNLEKENSILFVMGFSFADEHIRNIVKRALKTNPTLITIIFAYKDEEKDNFLDLFGSNDSNLIILTPSEFSANNDMKEDKVLTTFDFRSINLVFEMLSKQIPVHFGNGK